MLPLLKGLRSFETFKCLALSFFFSFTQYIVSTYSVKEMLVGFLGKTHVKTDVVTAPVVFSVPAG